MNLLNFISQYPDEISCRLKFKEFRDRHGVICPHCGSREHYWKKTGNTTNASSAESAKVYGLTQ